MTTTQNTNEAAAETIAEVVELASKAKPVRKAPAKKVAVKAPAKKVAVKASAKKAAAAKVAAIYDADVVVARIKALRAEGVAWRPLSATLNAEGITTVRGAQFSANGSTAFLIAKKHGVK